ncbi:MAG: hypothetical protein MK212_12645 [Saprospiraceae bacterium]|nr:hypothetical protein [Saprospiraceae bacterium]
MNEERNMYEQLQELLGQLSGGFKVIEHGFDPDLVTFFQKTIEDIKKESTEDTVETIQERLDTETNIDVLKKYIAQLAQIGSVPALRTLESYEKTASEELISWVRLSLTQCRIKVESDLLDDPIGYITTGLGGKNNKIRYYMAAKSVDPFTTGRVQFAYQEFRDVLKEWNGELESMENMGDYLLFRLLAPLNIIIPDMISEGIDRCGFLDSQFWLSNMQKPTDEDLEEWLRLEPESE